MSSSLEEDDNISFFFEVDLPKSVLSDGRIIQQFAQLTRKDAPNAEKLTVGCEVMVGNVNYIRVERFEGNESMAFSA